MLKEVVDNQNQLSLPFDNSEESEFEKDFVKNAMQAPEKLKASLLMKIFEKQS